MYKTKPCFPCAMPSDARLNVFALNASLKHDPDLPTPGSWPRWCSEGEQIQVSLPGGSEPL